MGRVFSLYDMLYNLAYVVGPAITIPLLPSSGKSYPVVLVIGALFLAAGFAYPALTRSARKGEEQAPPARPTQPARR
jgi:hypothetical protein